MYANRHMKISDFNKITVKDISGLLKDFDWNSFKDLLNWQSVKERLSRNPVSFICPLMVIITIIAVIMSFRIYKDIAITQKTEVSDLRKRSKAVSIFESTQKEYRVFLAKSPQPISESKLIKMLSEIAFARNVQITSFSPASKEDTGYVSLTNVEITITTEDYANAIRFINDIENSPHAIRIGKWSGILKMPHRIAGKYSRGFYRRVDSGAKKDENIEAKIKIETVEFNNE